MVIDSVKQNPPAVEVLIGVAIKAKQKDIIYHLLQRMDCDRNQGIVNWSKLHLRQIEPEWMPAIASFVHYLDLSHNKLHVFQDSLLPLTEMVRLDLVNNLLETVPKALFQQANLRYLDLSRNRLKELPNTSSWSRSLEKLYLSNNKLRSLPDGMQNACLVKLKLDRNHFSDVPPCVPCILTLKDLDLSYNTFLSSLPNTLGQLLDLENFNLTGVDVGNVPLKHRKSAQDVVRYLRCKLRSAKEAYHMKIVVLGYQTPAKQLLVARLQGDAQSPIVGRKERSSSPDEISDEGSSGSDRFTQQPNLIITDWECKPKSWGKSKIEFSVWNFTGYEPYYSTHHCFLTGRCLCLLAFEVAKGVQGVKLLSPWLDSIVSQAPDATVVVVGYKFDAQGDAKLDDRLIMQISNQWRKMASDGPYSSLHYGGIVFVNNELDSRKGFLKLREAVYSAAIAVFEREKKSMKHLVPHSYLQVAKRISAHKQHCKQRNKCPIMTKNDVLTMIHEIPGQDIDNPQEQKEMVEYLNKAGSVMHFNIPNSDIHQLLFIDPPWLYELMSRVIYARPRSSAATSGLLRRDDLPILFPCHRFSTEYHAAFLRLLNRYSIAIMIDADHMLVPALLPSSPVSAWPNRDSPRLQLRRIYTFTHLAAGFWSRLLARLILSLKDIAAALDVDHQVLFQPIPSHSPVYAGQRFDFSSDSLRSDTTEQVNGGASTNADHQLVVEEARHSQHDPDDHSLMSVTEVQYNWFGIEQSERHQKVDETQAKEIGLSKDTKPHTSKRKPAGLRFQQKTSETVSLNQTATSPLDGDIEFVSLPKVRSQSSSFQKEVVERALHYWRYGMSCRVGNSFFCVRKKTDTTTGTDRELEVVASADEAGQKIMALIVDILYALLKEWFPALLESPSSDFFVQQTVTCSQCSRLGVQCVNNFILETCVESCLLGNPVKCHQHIKEPPNITELVPEIVFSDLPDSLIVTSDQLHFGEKLGGTGSIQVFQALVDSQRVAIKAYTLLSTLPAQCAFYQMRAEMKHLRSVDHPNIIRLLGVCPRPAGLVLEFAPLGSLNQYLSGSRVRLERLLLCHIANQIAAALCHLHSKHIVHRDLNPRAVLVFSLSIEDSVNIKLCDFGASAIEFPSGLKGNEGHGAYRAPEIVQSNGMEEYDASVDIFSFAMVLYEMITYQKPFEAEEKTDISTLILQNLRPHLGDYPVPEGGMYCLAELMRHCWEIKPSDRPKPSYILSSMVVPQCQCLMGCQVLPNSDCVRLMCLVPQAEEVWVFAEEKERLVGYVLDVHTLIPKCLIADGEDFDLSKYRAQCAVAVGADTVWVGVVENAILIFDVKNRTYLEMNKTDNCSVLSLVNCHDKVFAGLNHGRLSVYEETSLYKHGRIVKMGTEPILSVASVGHEVWCCCGDQLYAVNADTLDTICSMPCEQAVTGLVVSPDGQSMWSMHRKLALLSCWDVTSHSLLYSFDCFRPDSSVKLPGSESPTVASGRSRCHTATPYGLAGDRVLSVLPLADTIWVGTAIGFILIFRTPEPELLTQFRAHSEKVRSLVAFDLPTTEHGIVLSGATGFQQDPDTDILYKTDNAAGGTVLMWEAIPGSHAKLLEQRSQRE